MPSLRLTVTVICCLAPVAAAAQSDRRGFYGEVTAVCSVVVPNNWRDTMVVPRGWSAEDCRDLAIEFGASHFQAGCFFSYGQVKSEFGQALAVGTSRRQLLSALPDRDCGWDLGYGPPPADRRGSRQYGR